MPHSQYNPFEDFHVERLVVLETKFDSFIEDQKVIKQQLAELLTLKSKGMGAIWLIGLIMSTGLVGLFATISSLFANRGHL